MKPLPVEFLGSITPKHEFLNCFLDMLWPISSQRKRLGKTTTGIPTVKRTECLPTTIFSSSMCPSLSSNESERPPSFASQYFWLFLRCGLVMTPLSWSPLPWRPCLVQPCLGASVLVIIVGALVLGNLNAINILSTSASTSSLA